MGPSIILDKSAVEAIGTPILWVQSEFFYTVVTPILVWEVCGDIQKCKEGKCHPPKVQSLARRAKPLNSIVTTDWRKLCTNELLGFRFDMGGPGVRRAVVDGAHRVPLEDGGFGAYIEQQPEAEALLRWSHGEWTQSDSQYAAEWRRMTRALDLDSLKRRFGPARQPLESTDQLLDLVRRLLADDSLQYFLISLLIDDLNPVKDVRKRLLRRWAGTKTTTWQSGAPYSTHCLRTFLTFYLAVGGGLVGTRATNRVDLEYLLYLPFAPIFVSGDEGTHGKLVPLLIEKDQTFVRASTFRDALLEHATTVEAIKTEQSEPSRDAFEPAETSLIRTLWINAWGSFRPPPSTWTKKESSESSRRPGSIAAEFKKAMAYVDAHPEKYTKRPPWPQL